ncbi:Lsr2 family DNA-binding protein [Actinacidiphila glaucinigra]|uniref:Lsr2 family DNA-binding protein n=1 Tax=Actinacidiphila glaucinigra TaxID=235986 RepID=UPI0035E0E373
MSEAGDPRQAWRRVTTWLEQHAPDVFDPRPKNGPVRVWARANGFLVSDRGRIPASIREAYEATL